MRTVNVKEYPTLTSVTSTKRLHNIPIFHLVAFYYAEPSLLCEKVEKTRQKGCREASSWQNETTVILSAGVICPVPSNEHIVIPRFILFYMKVSVYFIRCSSFFPFHPQVISSVPFFFCFFSLSSQTLFATNSVLLLMNIFLFKK